MLDNDFDHYRPGMDGNKYQRKLEDYGTVYHAINIMKEIGLSTYSEKNIDGMINFLNNRIENIK